MLSSPHHTLSDARPDTSDALAGTTSPGLPAAVLWDMDGTLINSEPYWMAAEAELTQAYGLEWSYEQGLQLVGSALPRSAQVLQEHGVPLSVPEIIDFLITRVAAAVGDDVPWQPGAVEILAWLRSQDVPCALVTMSYRVLADVFVEHTAPGTFAAVVSGDEVTHGKPDPEAYLRAAELLGVDIADCVVVEDSPTGIGSALASGAAAVGVEVVVPLPDDPRLTRLPALTALTPEVLGRVVAGEVVDLLPAQA